MKFNIFVSVLGFKTSLIVITSMTDWLFQAKKIVRNISLP